MHDPAVPLLRRSKPPKTVISLVPMIDVMLILLVFFMVTSTYLNLDMIPAVAQQEDGTAPSASSDARSVAPLLVRLGADGIPTVQGRALDSAAFRRVVTERIAENPMARILILPSGSADMQALISVMDAATQIGATNVSIVRLEASQ